MWRSAASASSHRWRGSSLLPIFGGSGQVLRSRVMASPVSTLTTRIAYGARQLPRVAWYVGHGMLMRRLSEEARQRDGANARPRAQAAGPMPEQRRLYA